MAESRELLQDVPAEYRDSFEWRYLNQQFRGSDLTCAGHSGSVWSSAFSPDGSWVASGGDDKTIRFWASDDGRPLTSVEYQAGVKCLVVSSDGTRVFSGHHDGTISITNVASKAIRSEFTGHAIPVNCVAVSSDGAKLVTGGRLTEDGANLTVWDVVNGVEIWSKTTHLARNKKTSGNVDAAAFSPDGRRIVTGGLDQTLRLWDAETGEQLKIFEGHTDAVECVAFSPDGKHIASGSRDETVRLWRVDGNLERTLRGQHGFVDSVSFSPDGSRLVSSGFDGVVRVWDLQSAEELHSLAGHIDAVYEVRFSPNGGRIVSGSGDGDVRIWDARDGTRQLVVRHSRPKHQLVQCAAFGQDTSRVLEGFSDGLIRLRDVGSGELMMRAKCATGVESLALSRDGSLVAAGAKQPRSGGSLKNNLTVWDSVSGSLRWATKFKQRVACVAFSPRDNCLAAASKNEITLWKITHDTAKELTLMKTHTVMQPANIESIAFSPDGKRLAGGGRNRAIMVWNVETGQRVSTIATQQGRIRCVAFDEQEGAVFAACGWPVKGQPLTVWSAEKDSGSVLFTKKVRGLVSLGFSSDGKRVAAAGDGAVTLWDTRTGREVLSMEDRGAKSLCVKFARDGECLYSVYDDATIRYWRAPANLASPEEKAIRLRKSQLDGAWHSQQADHSGTPFSSAVHAAWALKANPRSPTARRLFMASYMEVEKTDKSLLPLLPPVVAEALKLLAESLNSEETPNAGNQLEIRLRLNS